LECTIALRYQTLTLIPTCIDSDS